MEILSFSCHILKLYTVLLYCSLRNSLLHDPDLINRNASDISFKKYLDSFYYLELLIKND